MSEIVNAVIESVSLDDSDRGLLSSHVFLDYGGSGQGFGGYALYLPKSFSNHELKSVAGHFIWRCMEVAEVRSWDKMKGKTVRVKIENGLAVAIGHIVKDDWFEPRVDFKNVEQHYVKRELVEEFLKLQGWSITYDPKPIPYRSDDFDFIHEDYDGENGLCGTTATFDDALSEIMGKIRGES